MPIAIMLLVYAFIVVLGSLMIAVSSIGAGTRVRTLIINAFGIVTICIAASMLL